MKILSTLDCLLYHGYIIYFDSRISCNSSNFSISYGFHWFTNKFFLGYLSYRLRQ